MNNINDILKSKIKSEDVYSLPADYFERLNSQLEIQITNQRTSLFRFLFRIAATILLLIGIGVIYHYQTAKLHVSYLSLINGVDEYLLEDDELFYTFLDDDFQYDKQYISSIVDDYLNTEINFQ